MRKRLRKKRHLAEFQELGVEITITLKPGVNFGLFLEHFLCGAVEANGLSFGGGGSDTSFSGYIELGKRDAHLSNLEKVRAWLSDDPRIESYRLSEPVDAWYTEA